MFSRTTLVCLGMQVLPTLAAAIPAGEDAYETYTAAVTRLARRNLRLTLEYTYDAKRETGRGAVGIVSAF